MLCLIIAWTETEHLFSLLILWHLRRNKALFFLSTKKPNFWHRLLKRKVRNISFEWVRFLTDSVFIPEQDMIQKNTGEQDIIKSQDWLKNTKNSYMKHGWIFWSGEDYISNMQMISWVSKRCSQSPSWPVVLQQFAFQNQKCLIVWYTSSKRFFLPSSASID